MAVSLKRPFTATVSAAVRSTHTSLSLPASCRCFSVLNRPPPNYEGHIPLTRVERLGLAAGSGLLSFLDPRRGDLIAAFGEATAQPYFIYKLRDRMLLNPTGRRILRDRPRLTSTSLAIPRLRQLPSNTLGYAYAAWLDREGVSPDTRAHVRYIDDEECAYVMQRYRECHDFYHALVGLPVFREGEVALKAFEYANTGLPMTGLAVFSALTLKKAEWRRFWDIYGPWAIRNGTKTDDVINIYWEEELETDINELRARIGIEKPPDLRTIRKAARDKKKQEKEGREHAAASAV
ncbi:coenzyme Q biosynthesis protein Coq4-domain-containing protein [Lophiotrema nucula]|uniref:4-hydroxy-3-methoxy-5-polyprenylbenzoate decarboxylase n=1 Tax=Lophiotrema nucula TaxID=690887 RepID=A0A6A5YUJ4_9PLEO|nr:coenzyme Q biosynthesis protein Coq4-domain-containing protein [Lophiotrema nucula]